MKPDPITTDEELIDHFLDGARAGREHAFEAMVERHGPMVMRVCRRILGRYQDAEDASQETFLSLARNAGDIRDRRVLRIWLREVASRIAIRARTRAARSRTVVLPHEERITPEEAQRAAVDNELRQILQIHLDRLPQKYRMLVVHCHLEGKSYEEAARLMGRPVGTVKGWLSRARGAMRGELLQRGFMRSE
jgi:polysaccharide biosynthesis/export protein